MRMMLMIEIDDDDLQRILIAGSNVDGDNDEDGYDDLVDGYEDIDDCDGNDVNDIGSDHENDCR